ncbi:MAG TPA: hypothetical protein PK265_02790 [Candidatus Saccharibacteria bacterium]|nr:hypothetical protein [Candidatus Saccharibacteria bacterium]
MSKISKYLNEHLLGEVTVDEAIREQFANDSSILKIKPELIVSPRVTNDIRKVARFTWQLAAYYSQGWRLGSDRCKYRQRCNY